MSKNRKRQKQLPQRNYSTIPEHKRQGKKLIPPLRQIFEKDEPSASWLNERLPEMLWAILLVTHLPRKHAIHVFRQIAIYIQNLPKEDQFEDVTHTGLVNLSPKHLDDVLSIITAQQEQKEALAPLLLLEGLPGQETWIKALNTDNVEDNWLPLMAAVECTIDHQSQESTDCRWLKVLCHLVPGKLRIGLEKREDREQRAKEILYYPDYGDLSRIESFIRATEIMLSTQSEWSATFWDECLAKTSCLLSETSAIREELSMGTTLEHLGKIYDLLIEHTYKTRLTSGVDARHDTTFGMGFYCLGLLQELLRVGNCYSISARPILRTIAECNITLAYLAKKDDAELWLSYRAYGSERAKLALLRLNELGDKPSYVDIQTLDQIANEDRWQELVDINFSHWNKTDLRRMSIEANVKDVYDRFYDWTSTFTHGHWGAIRDTVFDTCHNPLHRLHRIPRQSVRTLPDVVPDACQLVDTILEVVSQLYPEFPHRVTL
jgi:hypothetical protein